MQLEGLYNDLIFSLLSLNHVSHVYISLLLLLLSHVSRV